MPTESQLIVLGLALFKMSAWIVPTVLGTWLAHEIIEFKKPWRL